MADEDYGVKETGYVRRPLSVILSEIEERMIEVFGEGVLQTPQEPLGQLNGLEADLLEEVDQRNLDLYQSYDPDQAEGTRLDTLFKLRLGERNNRSDIEIRQAMTNKNEPRIDVADLVNSLKEIPDVSYVKVFINDTDEIYEGFERGSLAVVVLGGDLDLIGNAMRRHVVPGIPTRGNTLVNTSGVEICRSFYIFRPTLIDVTVNMTVKRRTKVGSPPPSLVSIRESVVQNWPSDRENGLTPDFYSIRKIIECDFDSVEVLSVEVIFDGEPALIAFDEIANILSDNVTVVENE